MKTDPIEIADPVEVAMRQLAPMLLEHGATYRDFAGAAIYRRAFQKAADLIREAVRDTYGDIPRGHHHETWQVREDALGEMYCAACGVRVSRTAAA